MSNDKLLVYHKFVCQICYNSPSSPPSPFISSDVAFFQKWLGRYRLEHIQAKNCPTEKDLGLILVDTQQLKAQLLPSPLRCLEVRQHQFFLLTTPLLPFLLPLAPSPFSPPLRTSYPHPSHFPPPQALHDILPRKAKTMMDHLIQTSQDAVIKLEGDPSSTIDYVNLLRYISRTDASQTALLRYFRGWLIFRPLPTIDISPSCTLYMAVRRGWKYIQL